MDVPARGRADRRTSALAASVSHLLHPDGDTNTHIYISKHVVSLLHCTLGLSDKNKYIFYPKKRERESGRKNERGPSLGCAIFSVFTQCSNVLFIPHPHYQRLPPRPPRPSGRSYLACHFAAPYNATHRPAQ